MSVTSRDGDRAAPRLVASARSSQFTPGAIAAIAAGGIALLAGGFFLLSGKTSPEREVIRPIPELAAELDREQLKAALVTQAFPDKAGEAFMERVAAAPDDRDALLEKMADAAKAGADRHGLVQALDAWSKDFTYTHYQAITRAGSMGFDKAMHRATAQIDLMSKSGGCSVSAVRHLIDNPFVTASVPDYGTPGYNLLLQSNATLLDLAAAGAKRPPVSSGLRVSDGEAVLGAFKSHTKDPMAMSVVKTYIVAAGGDTSGKPKKKRRKKGAEPVTQLKADDVDVCALGKTLIGKLQGLPAETKDRLWAKSFGRTVTAHVIADR